MTIKVGSYLKQEGLLKGVILLNAEVRNYGVSKETIDTWELLAADAYLSSTRVKQLIQERQARSKAQTHARLLEKLINSIDKAKKDKDLPKLQADEDKLNAFLAKSAEAERAKA